MNQLGELRVLTGQNYLELTTLWLSNLSQLSDRVLYSHWSRSDEILCSDLWNLTMP